MRRAIERLLEDPIAEAILRGELAAGISSRAIRPEGTDRIDFAELPPPAPEPEPAQPELELTVEPPAKPARKRTASRKKTDSADSKATKKTEAPKKPRKKKSE